MAVGGTYYVQSDALSLPVLLAAVAPGAFSVNILLVNNIRDIATDRTVGKMTLPARIGGEWARRLYIVLTVVAFLVPVFLFLNGDSPWGMLSLLSAPLAFSMIRQLYASEGRALNHVLAGTGKLMTLHGLLFAVGILIQ